MSTRVIAARSCAPRSRRISCPNCAFTAREWRRSLTSTEAGYFEEQIVHNRSVRRGDYVHRSGATLMALSIINSGFLKTSLTSSNGNVQITGFSMRGDMVGLDALGIGIYQCDTIALEDSRLCSIEHSRFEQLARDIPALQHIIHQKMSTEIMRGQNVMVSLGTMQADERLFRFLLDLSKRFAALGCAKERFRLPMWRQEIGEYLGLKLSTVCRMLSHLQEIDAIAIDGKDITIKNVPSMWQSVQIEPPVQQISRLHQTPSNFLQEAV